MDDFTRRAILLVLLAVVVYLLEVWVSQGSTARSTVVRVVDGDTLKVNIDDLPRWMNPIGVRIRGVDAPELTRARCCREKCLATAARDLMIQHFPTDSNITLANPMKGKYFRIIADVLNGAGENAGNLLLAQGYAVRYNGRGDRQDWCGDKAYARHECQELCSRLE